MTMTAWLALATICVLGAMSPGPSLALMIRNTVFGGAKFGLATAFGHSIGVAVYAAITAMGLGVVVSQTPWLFALIKYTGAGFLLFQAIRVLRNSSQNTKNGSVNGGSNRPESCAAGFSDGFLLAFLNPKLAIFFLALFSQFLSADQGVTDHLIMVLTAGAIEFSWYTVVVLGIAGTGLIGVLQRNGVWIDRVSAVAFIGLAGFVLFN